MEELLDKYDEFCFLCSATISVWFQNGYDVMQTQALAGGYQGEWPEYQYAEQLAYPEQYLQPDMQAYDVQGGLNNILQDPRFMTQEEKDRGLGSVFKRDDQRLQQLREKDAREKDPNFISESYSECYPGYQEYNREIVDSDDEDDLSKMDMGGRVSHVKENTVLSLLCLSKMRAWFWLFHMFIYRLFLVRIICFLSSLRLFKTYCATL